MQYYLILRRREIMLVPTLSNSDRFDGRTFEFRWKNSKVLLLSNHLWNLSTAMSWCFWWKPCWSVFRVIKLRLTSVYLCVYSILNSCLFYFVFTRKTYRIGIYLIYISLVLNSDMHFTYLLRTILFLRTGPLSKGCLEEIASKR